MNNHPIIQNLTYFNNSMEFYPETNQKQAINFVTTEQLYNAVFENAFHAMYIETEQGEILKFNKELADLFGYNKMEMNHMKMMQLFEVNEPSFFQFLNERKEKGIAKGEINGIKKFSKTFPCRISSVNYLSDEGEKRSLNTIVNISPDLSARWNIGG